MPGVQDDRLFGAVLGAVQAQNFATGKSAELEGVHACEIVGARRHPWHVRSWALAEKGGVLLHALPEQLWRVAGDCLSLGRFRCWGRFRCLCWGLCWRLCWGLLGGRLGSHVLLLRRQAGHSENSAWKLKLRAE